MKTLRPMILLIFACLCSGCARTEPVFIPIEPISVQNIGQIDVAFRAKLVGYSFFDYLAFLVVPGLEGWRPIENVAVDSDKSQMLAYSRYPSAGSPPRVLSIDLKSAKAETVTHPVVSPDMNLSAFFVSDASVLPDDKDHVRFPTNPWVGDDRFMLIDLGARFEPERLIYYDRKTLKAICEVRALPGVRAEYEGGVGEFVLARLGPSDSFKPYDEIAVMTPTNGILRVANRVSLKHSLASAVDWRGQRWIISVYSQLRVYEIPSLRLVREIPAQPTSGSDAITLKWVPNSSVLAVIQSNDSSTVAFLDLDTGQEVAHKKLAASGLDTHHRDSWALFADRAGRYVGGFDGFWITLLAIRPEPGGSP